MSIVTEQGLKGNEENYLLDKYLLRKVSVHVTKVIASTPISPNWVTFVSLVCCLSSLVFLASNQWFSVIVGCVLIYLYNLLDHVDGELARIRVTTGRQKPSIAGQYFDVLCHSYSHNLMLLVTSWAVYTKHGQPWILVLGVIAMSATSGFANLIACKVLIMKIIRTPAVLDSPAAMPALALVEKKKLQISDVNAPLFSFKGLRKLAKEIIGYPGILLLIISAHLFDLFNNGYSVLNQTMDARVALIVTAAAVHGFYSVFLVRKYIRLFSVVQ